MTPTCWTCNVALNHVTGHAVIRLYRCEKCGAQQMLPGDPSAPEPEARAAPPPQEKKGLLARIFGG